MLPPKVNMASQTCLAPLGRGSAALSSSLVRARHQQQTRAFRFGLWSSYLDPSFQKELRRRHRIVKHKYAEALNRKLSWEWRQPADLHRRAIKTLLYSSWKGRDPRPGGRWVSMDDLKPVPEYVRANGGIEDVERSALDAAWPEESRAQIEKALHSYGYKIRSWATGTLSNSEIPEEKSSTKTGQASTVSATSQGSTDTPELEYDIDPISNRKVFKRTGKLKDTKTSTKPTKPIIQTFKGYRSQFDKSDPRTVNEDASVKIISKPIEPLQTEFSGTIDIEHPPVQGELESYKPFEYNEPDGRSVDEPDSVAEGLSEYDRRSKTRLEYDEPGEESRESVDSVAKGLRDYDDHSRSKPEYNEYYATSEETIDPVARALSEYDNCLSHKITSPSSHQFSPSRLYKFDTASSDKVEDLDLLRASDIRAASGIMKGTKLSTEADKFAKRQALEADFANSTQNQELVNEEEQAASRKVKEIRRCAQELENERSELLNHNAHAMGHVKEKLGRLDGHTSATQTAIGAGESAPSPNKMTGNFARDFPEEFSVSWTSKSPSRDNLLPKGKVDPWGYDVAPQGLELSYRDEMDSNAMDRKYSNPASAELNADGAQNSSPSRLQTSLDRKNAQSAERMQVEADPYTKEPTGLEISYSNECIEQGEAKPAVFCSTYCAAEQKSLNPSQDLEFGNEQEMKNTIRESHRALVRELRDIYESEFGPISNSHRQVAEEEILPSDLKSVIKDAEEAIRNTQYLGQELHLSLAKLLAARVPPESPTPATDAEPTVYQILAYDPTMQAVSIAETTSIVTDTSAALTPAEVLLRLSHPAKFFPHFKPLRDQGYEIVSGSGDVLVFRKVRNGAPAAEPVVAQSDAPPSIATNPIDGMQAIRPATGNFASPTGFVNHDLPEAPFKSGIDVRREEPIFSGRSSGWQESERARGKRKPIVKRVLIGAAWVTGCTYAIAVVIEFFTTGGADGKGAVGL